MNNSILDFYRGSEANFNGWYFSNILDFTDAELEYIHNYIQFLFPLTEPSQYQPDSPVLSPADVTTMRTSPKLQEHMRMALIRMRLFYEKNGHWITPHNHNFLRITRILKSLMLCGLSNEAKSFRNWLHDLGYDHIFGESIPFWDAAMKEPAMPVVSYESLVPYTFNPSFDAEISARPEVISDKHRILAHCMGGSSIFTISNAATGKSFTYHVKNKKGAPVFYVRVLTGPDNRNDYTYLGTVFGSVPDKDPVYAHGRRTEINFDAPSAVAFRWFWQQLTTRKDKSFPKGFEFLPSGRCIRCCRMLTNTDSIKSGIGPECAGKMEAGRF